MLPKPRRSAGAHFAAVPDAVRPAATTAACGTPLVPTRPPPADVTRRSRRLRHPAAADGLPPARRSSSSQAADGCRRVFVRTAAVACLALGACSPRLPLHCRGDGSRRRARSKRNSTGIRSARRPSWPRWSRAPTDASGPERRYVYALYGQAMVAAGRTAEALALADRLEREAANPSDDLASRHGPARAGNGGMAGRRRRQGERLAKEARALLKGASDPYLAYWAAMTIGITARSRGQLEEALGSLQDALSMAERDDDAYRRSGALYQLSTLYLVLKQPQNALDASLQAYRFAELAGSTPGMVKARMAESAALEMLDDPVRELAAMEEALALARKSRSQVGESLALINLADITAAAQGIRRRAGPLAPVARARRRVQRHGGRSRPARRTSDSRCSASDARPKASGSPTRRSPNTSAPARPPRSRRCSASTASTSRRQATTRPRWRSSTGRTGSTRKWPLRRTSGRCSSCRKNTSRKETGAKSNCSTARTRSTRPSSKTRGCGSVSGGSSPRSS